MNRRTRPSLESLEGRALLSDMAYRITSNQSSYQPGQAIVMTFQATNESDHAISVDDGPSIDGFDVSQGGKVIWRSNAGLNPMFLRQETLQPGQSLTLSATWDGVPNGGTAPASGTFSIANQLAPQATATVTIARGGPTPTAPTVPPTTTTPVVGTPTSPIPIPVTAVPTSTTGTDPTLSPGSQDRSTTPSTTASESSPIAVSVSTDHPTYHKRRPVQMALTLQNVSNSTVSLPIDSTDVFTVLEGSRTVWRTARAVSGIGSVTLQPGQSVTVTAVWDGRAHNAGVPLARGTYTVVASDWGYSGSTTFRVTA